MRIGVISDIHTDASPANKEIVKYIADAVDQAELDVFIICGDISPSAMTLSWTLSAFQDPDSKRKNLFVAGNHDIWLSSKSKTVTSHDKYSLITALCNEHGFHHLGDSPFILRQVGFCGTIGWYDYSYKNDKYPISESAYMRKTLAGNVWNDVNYAKWNDFDIQMAKRFEKELQDQINSIKDNISRIVVATHHIPFSECVTYRNEVVWDFFSAFMGSVGLGEICISESLVTHALFGHTHSPCSKRIAGVQAICSPVGYLTKPPKNLEEYARNRLKIIDLID